MRTILVTLGCFVATTAAAQMSDLDRMQLATSLGSVIGSEEACGLSYDQDAIAAFIEKKVQADDMKFPSTLNMMVDGSRYNLGQMSQSAKTAHCAQIKRVAKSFAFTK